MAQYYWGCRPCSFFFCDSLFLAEYLCWGWFCLTCCLSARSAYRSWESSNLKKLFRKGCKFYSCMLCKRLYLTSVLSKLVLFYMLLLAGQKSFMSTSVRVMHPYRTCGSAMWSFAPKIYPKTTHSSSHLRCKNVVSQLMSRVYTVGMQKATNASLTVFWFYFSSWLKNRRFFLEPCSVYYERCSSSRLWCRISLAVSHFRRRNVCSWCGSFAWVAS